MVDTLDVTETSKKRSGMQFHSKNVVLPELAGKEERHLTKNTEVYEPPLFLEQPRQRTLYGTRSTFVFNYCYHWLYRQQQRAIFQSHTRS